MEQAFAEFSTEEWGTSDTQPRRKRRRRRRPRPHIRTDSPVPNTARESPHFVRLSGVESIAENIIRLALVQNEMVPLTEKLEPPVARQAECFAPVRAVRLFRYSRDVCASLEEQPRPVTMAECAQCSQGGAMRHFWNQNIFWLSTRYLPTQRSEQDPWLARPGIHHRRWQIRDLCVFDQTFKFN